LVLVEPDNAASPNPQRREIVYFGEILAERGVRLIGATRSAKF